MPATHWSCHHSTGTGATREGLGAARARGRVGGRPSVVTQDDQGRARPPTRSEPVGDIDRQAPRHLRRHALQPHPRLAPHPKSHADVPACPLRRVAQDPGEDV